jgi:hypothetical protein
MSSHTFEWPARELRPKLLLVIARLTIIAETKHKQHKELLDQFGKEELALKKHIRESPPIAFSEADNVHSAGMDSLRALRSKMTVLEQQIKTTLDGVTRARVWAEECRRAGWRKVFVLDEADAAWLWGE